MTIAHNVHAAKVALTDSFGWRNDGHRELKIWASGYGRACDIEFVERCFGELPSDPTVEQIAEIVRQFDGHFALVVAGKGWICAVVDRVRSIPIAYAESTDGWIIDNQADRLRKRLDFSQSQTDSAAALALGMSGYTIDDATLYRDIKLLGPGDLVLFRDGAEPEHERYYCYRPWRADKPQYEPDTASKELSETLLSTIERMMAGIGDRLLIVPLSAGRDSRVIVSAAHHLGYRNIRTFAYGRPGNHEAATSRYIAEALGFEWRFVPLTTTLMQDYYAGEDWANYCRFADTLQATPFVQDHPQIRLLKEEGYIPDDAVIANGNSGDYISGAHIFPKSSDVGRDKSEEQRLLSLLHALSEKHFALWKSLRSAENCAKIERLLKRSIDRAGAKVGEPEDDFGLFEYAEFQDRQCKYVIGGQRIYEYLGHEWRLPLWDNALLRFFETMPREAKLDQRLYAETLLRENWADVWQNVPVNARTIKPNWIRPFRLLAKIVHAPFGRDRWHEFEKRYFGYWMELGGQSAIRPYADVARDSRGARHGVAWLTEAYLRRHGLDYAGDPIS